MKYLFFLSSALCYSVSSLGQTRIEFGPHLGLNAGTAVYNNFGRDLDTKFALRGEIGATASVRWGHWGLLASGLFAQKGFRIDDEYNGPTDGSSNLIYMHWRQNYRLDYLTVPVNLVYHWRADGQGLQLFAGGYVGRLLGGRYRYDDVNVLEWDGAPLLLSGKGHGRLRTTDRIGDETTREWEYLRPWDAGVQAGLGYRHQRLLVQLGYTRSLRDLGPEYPGQTSPYQIIRQGASYKLRGVQLAATYLLFGTKP